jgi:hypothetical protein
MTKQDLRQMDSAAIRTTKEIAFLAISQAHQFLHWLPAALRLAREPGLKVTVLVSTKASEDFIRSYDPEGRLHIERLRAPSLRRHGLFTPPHRLSVLLMNARSIARYPTIVTTETTSSWLRRLPRFRSEMVHLNHGAGDREAGYERKHRHFDLTLVSGSKDRQRMIERGLATAGTCVVAGCGKFELVRSPSGRLFEDERPIALYNPHFDRRVSSWRHSRRVLRAMESIAEWNFVVAPHVRLRSGRTIRSKSPNIMIDRGSTRSIDMTYTQSAAVYIGDASSQVYEFIRNPRPCIFLNFDHVDWRADPAYTHWHFGQVIEDIEELPAALTRAYALQPRFEPVQLQLYAVSIEQTAIPASERQAQAIIDFARRA